jgi:diguanylate cyclase (GGDEF)-like protein
MNERSGEGRPARGRRPRSRPQGIRPRRITPHTPGTAPDLSRAAAEALQHAEDAHRGRMAANLIVIAHPDAAALGRRYVLEPGHSLDIGRSHECAVSFPDVASVSRHHARVRYAGAAVVVEDLGSTNGTWVGDRRVQGVQSVGSGERFQVGAVHFKLLHERDVEAAYHAAMYELGMRDGLTQACNKRKFDEEARREWARARRHRRPLSLILFDLDHFKDVNDTRGHLAGDMVLEKTAALVSALLRIEEVFARVGGEEFAILCPETPMEGAATLAERLRQSVGAHVHDYGGARFEVTCSVGVAELAPGDTFEDLYAAADRALYAAKQGGRNRVSRA